MDLGKLLLFSATLVFSSIALAEVKPDGFVMDSYCASAIEQGPLRAGGFMIAEACTATIVSLPGKYVVIKETRYSIDGAHTQKTVWKVTRERVSRSGVLQNLHQVGSVSPEGIFQVSLETITITGEVVLKMQNGQPHSMSGKLLNRQFKTEVMQGIAHTRRL